MAKKRTIRIAVACISLTVFTVQTLSQVPTRHSRLRDMKGMTEEERKKEMENWRYQRRQQELKKSEERMKVMAREAWKRLLRVNERQWRIIEPKFEKVGSLVYEKWAGASGWGVSDAQNFHWHRHSKGSGGKSAKAPHEMTEGQRIADEIVGLLEDEKSKDEEIRRKIDALQQVREKARKELPEVGKELAALLTNPRQEAIFLIMGYID